jgi:hypothetical protein
MYYVYQAGSQWLYVGACAAIHANTARERKAEAKLATAVQREASRRAGAEKKLREMPQRPGKS